VPAGKNNQVATDGNLLAEDGELMVEALCRMIRKKPRNCGKN